MNTRPLAIRFWEKVKIGGINDCWEWTGCRSKNYGKIRLKKAWLFAHRVSAELHFGVSDLYVCHRCDNPPCVNPAHLFYGSARENAIDAARKGRLGIAKGSNNGNSRLSEWDLPEIRRMLAKGNTKTEIAKQYAVTRGTIYHISKGLTWKAVG